jgi:hypothetical protein
MDLTASTRLLQVASRDTIVGSRAPNWWEPPPRAIVETARMMEAVERLNIILKVIDVVDFLAWRAEVLMDNVRAFIPFSVGWSAVQTRSSYAGQVNAADLMPSGRRRISSLPS